MEISPQQPYQEEPISNYVDSPQHITTTVIQNSVYRDSVYKENSVQNDIVDLLSESVHDSNGVKNHAATINGQPEPDVLDCAGAEGGEPLSGDTRKKKHKRKRSKGKHKFKDLMPKHPPKDDKDGVVLRVDFLR